ncbi:hypothetical protein [Thioalkalivibrio sp. ALE6]|uniref:hypothetical protein n=1 Tax=Thioalkalivibrio sp. ALE6 TaxID=1266908 RepID=UPI000360EEA8|nr:hypothetical protein [Thioalkalivibrio sp. ALE6]
MTRGTEIMDHLLGLLAQIDPANGYHTDAGARAHRGRPDALADAQADEFPAILVRTDSNAPGASRPQQVQHQRAITVQGVTRAVGADYEPVLDNLAHDIFRALVPQGSRERLGGLATELTIDDCNYDHPEPGSDLAAVTYSITVTYVANYQQ